jgi:hypothetical protein
MAKYATRQSANKAKGPNQRVVQDGKGFKLVATNSLAGRASTTRTGIQPKPLAKPVANSGKGTGNSKVKLKPVANSDKGTGRSGAKIKPTTSAAQGVRTRARVLTGAGRQDGPNTSKPAAARAAASSAKKSVKRTAKRGVGAVRAGIATLKTKRLKAKRNKAARNLTKGSIGGKGKSYNQLTSKQKVAMGGGRRGPSETKRTTSQSIGVAKRSVKKAATTAGTTARSWGSAAQKAAIRKLAEFNRGRKRAGKAITRKAVKYGLASGARYGGNSGK